MSEPRETHVSNERLKAVSGVMFNLGAALFAAAIVKVYGDRSFSLETIGWLFMAGVAIWSAWLTLGLLETERQ